MRRSKAKRESRTAATRRGVLLSDVDPHLLDADQRELAAVCAGSYARGSSYRLQEELLDTPPSED